MAINTITYADKSAIYTNASIPDTNKVNDSDMNEIKTVVNDNATLMGDLTTLTTTTQSSVVAAINEVNGKFDYSTTETVIGKWINGETLYRKVLSFTTGNSAGDVNVNHNISNMGVCVKAYGYASNGSDFYELPSIYRDMSAVYTIAIYRVDSTRAIVTYGSNRTNLSGYLILEYTKTS